jgi:ATP-dependent DNA ligase
MPASLFDLRDLDIKLGTYRVGNASQLMDSSLQALAQDYKRLTSSRMIPLDRTEIVTKIPTAEYWASRKLDGEFTLAVARHDQVVLLNPGGTVRTGLPVTDELASTLGSKNIRSAILAGELHSSFAEKRERVHDVIRFARGPESQDDLAELHFSVFDILELDQDRDWNDFGKTWKKMELLFGSGTRVHPVPTNRVKNSSEIENEYVKQVEQTGGEGLVLRSNAVGLFKIKPRRTLDAVVIGFTESLGDRAGLLHDLLLALRRNDGTLHVLCRVGGGFTEDLRRSLPSDLKDMLVESEYAEVNSDHEAYRMVRPKLVAEISCLDLISQTTRGASIQRMTLDWDPDASLYRIVRRLPLVSVISPQFIRFRDDKSISYQDIRIDQVSQVVEVPLADKDAKLMKLPQSQLMRREVFTKVLKGETMVRKFLLWKTNKESVSAEHPAFVIHFTDFSPNRAQPLAREVRVSNSAEQIESLYMEMKEEHVKKGWTAVDGAEPARPDAAAQSSPVQPLATAESPTNTDSSNSLSPKDAAPPKSRSRKKADSISKETAKPVDGSSDAATPKSTRKSKKSQ